MPASKSETSNLLELHRLGDEMAHNDLIEHACKRLWQLTSRMLRSYPGVRRWEETDDVLQKALIRLWNALKAVKPDSKRHFYNLAALQIRRELIDLARHYRGPQSHEANHHTDGAGKAADDKGGSLAGVPAKPTNPSSPDALLAICDKVDSLPTNEREVVDLRFYHDLSCEVTAVMLAVSESTVKRRWQSARLKLHKAIKVAAIPD